MKKILVIILLLAVAVASSNAPPRNASASFGDFFTSQAERDRAEAERVRAETEAAKAGAAIRVYEETTSQWRGITDAQAGIILELAKRGAGMQFPQPERESDFGLGVLFAFVFGAACVAIWRWEGVRPGAFAARNVVPMAEHRKLHDDLRVVVARLSQYEGYGAIGYEGGRVALPAAYDGEDGRAI